jgi:phosphatidylglycerophosphatase A
MSQFPDPTAGKQALNDGIRPTWAWTRQKASRLIAFGFGSGLARPAPGTWGTLTAWVLWNLLMPDGLPAWTVFLALVVAFWLGVWACERAGADLGAPDHGGMVWDEMVAFWLVLWLIPTSLMAQAFGFLLFRLFDIMKPQPIRYFDSHLKGGLGVMLDDILAAGYALLAFAIFSWLFS